MKPFFSCFVAVLLLSSNAVSQKVELYADNIYMEVQFIEKTDSIAAEVKITNYSKENVYFPYIRENKKLQYVLSCVGEVLELSVGVSSRFTGIPLEFTHYLKQLQPNETVLFKSHYEKKENIKRSRLSFDFVTIADLRTIYRTSEVGEYVGISGENYASYIHVARAENSCNPLRRDN